MNDDKIKSYVKNIYEDYKKQFNREPSFEDLIKDCIYLKGIDKADFLFTTLKNGWEQNQFENTEFQKVFDTLFCYDRNYYYTEIEQYLINEIDTEFQANNDQISREEMEEIHKELLKQIQQPKNK